MNIIRVVAYWIARSICWIILVPLIISDLVDIWQMLTSPLIFSNSGITLGWLLILVVVFSWIHMILIYGALVWECPRQPEFFNRPSPSYLDKYYGPPIYK